MCKCIRRGPVAVKPARLARGFVSPIVAAGVAQPHFRFSLRRLKAASARIVSRLPRRQKGKTGLREEPGFREPAWGAGYIYQRGTNCTPLDLGGYGWRCSEVDYAEMQRRNNRGSRMSAMSFRECG
jgi:hypothetical protein